MATTYEPGQVAVGKVEQWPCRLLRSKGGWHFVPTDTLRPSGFVSDDQGYPDVTDVRPLIVLDLDGKVPAVVVNVLRTAAYDSLADQIEAQTKPPRIPEPGWGEKVIAHTELTPERQTWLHSGSLWTTQGNSLAPWSALIDPEAVTS